jgi:hypothetical protein
MRIVDNCRTVDHQLTTLHMLALYEKKPLATLRLTDEMLT